MSAKNTVKINNPHIPGDFIIIGQDEFVLGEAYPGHGIAAMELWTPGEQAGAAAAAELTAAAAAADIPQSARLAELKTMTVADLGPIIAQEEDVQLLERLLDLESRVTAQVLIEERLAELDDPDATD